MTRIEAYQKAILFLALPENDGKDFDFFPLLKELQIPNEFHNEVLAVLFDRNFINGPTSFGSPTVKITTDGNRYVEELKEKYFQEHKKPLNPVNTFKASLDEACEFLFQNHKKSGARLNWAKSTYDNAPDNLDLARERLLQKNIIYSKNNPDETYLNTDLIEVDSYQKAIDLLNFERYSNLKYPKNYFQKESKFFNKAFLIHGHNELLKNEVARFIEKELGKDVIILHEQANRGQTVIEKIEANSDVDFAVALWTADDEGMSKKDRNLHDRARQNVIYETGLFIGKLGRKNVIVIYENVLEIPSDQLGIVYLEFDGNWKHDLRKEIEAIYHI